MSKLRKIANGQPCMVRLVGVCNGKTETSVLAHYRLVGTCGIGTKPHDILGAWCCSACHDVCDGRVQSDYSREEVQLAHAEGVLRTQLALIKLGFIEVK